MGDKRRRHGERGFTLMEMLVVLVIMGLLIAVAVPQIMKMFGSAKHKTAGIAMETLTNSLHAYDLDVGSYPTTAQGLGALWTRPEGVERWDGPYLRREAQLTDPWGRVYVYRSPGEARKFDLGTLGADGKPGGTGEDADLDAAP